MKIAINTRFLLPGALEGVGVYTYEVTSRMVQQYDHEYYFLFDRPYDQRFIFNDRVKPVLLRPPARHPFLFYYWFQYRVAPWMLRNKMDVFFSPDGFMSLGISTPTVITIHDIAHYHFPEFNTRLMNVYYRRFIPKFLHAADKIITVSHFSKQDVLKSYGITDDKVHVVYNGNRHQALNLDSIVAKSLPKPYFFFVGSIHPRKNLKRVLQAFSKFNSLHLNGYQLIIAGRMAWKSNATEQAISEANGVSFIGQVSDHELSEWIKGSVGLLYPSLYEGFGFPIIEGLSHGVPVLTSNCSSMPEIGGAFVELVDPYSIESIARGLERLTERNRDFHRSKDEISQHVNQFDWDISTRKVYDIIVNSAMSQST